MTGQQAYAYTTGLPRRPGDVEIIRTACSSIFVSAFNITKTPLTSGLIKNWTNKEDDSSLLLSPGTGVLYESPYLQSVDACDEKTSCYKKVLRYADLLAFLFC